MQDAFFFQEEVNKKTRIRIVVAQSSLKKEWRYSGTLCWTDG